MSLMQVPKTGLDRSKGVRLFNINAYDTLLSKHDPHSYVCVSHASFSLHTRQEIVQSFLNFWPHDRYYFDLLFRCTSKFEPFSYDYGPCGFSLLWPVSLYTAYFSMACLYFEVHMVRRTLLDHSFFMDPPRMLSQSRTDFGKRLSGYRTQIFANIFSMRPITSWGKRWSIKSHSYRMPEPSRRKVI